MSTLATATIAAVVEPRDRRRALGGTDSGAARCRRPATFDRQGFCAKVRVRLRTLCDGSDLTLGCKLEVAQG
jgi:hypothetical protein